MNEISAIKNKFTLSRVEKLKSRKLIYHLFENGQFFYVKYFKVIYCFVEDNTFLKFGIGVKTKMYKRAVDRNRIKRITREAWRLNNLNLKQQLFLKQKNLHIFFNYHSNVIVSFNEVNESIKQAILLIEQKV